MPQKLTKTAISALLAELNAATASPWQIRMGKLHKQFIFSNFKTAMAFMQAASEEAEAINHHPEWSNVYNRVAINLTTHSINGLSELDFELAVKFDHLNQA